ncbi:MAG: hypothetical protein KF878_05775 [Planctomycetes bacterium]|nr:hypothetical protein [Planctomycetota bacterium]
MPNRPQEPDEGSDLEELDDDSGEGNSLARIRDLARGPDEPGARDELLAALQEPSEVWRLTALQGLARREAPADLAPLAASLLGSAADPFLQAEARLVLARAGEGDVVDLARRALGRRGRPRLRALAGAPGPRPARGPGWPLRRLSALA